MWWVVTGPYSYTNECFRELYTTPPEHPQVKANQARRRKRLESLMSAAAAKLDFKRAEVLKNILFPPEESLYIIWTDRHGGAYFGPSYSGYTTDTNQAGKYTRAELKPYLGAADEKDYLRAVPVRKKPPAPQALPAGALPLFQDTRLDKHGWIKMKPA